MKFNIKLFNYKRLYIYFCLLALLNIFFSTANVQAKTFNINDIEISTPFEICLLYTSPSPRDRTRSRMPSSA